jgi:hypothetical protein
MLWTLYCSPCCVKWECKSLQHPFTKYISYLYLLFTNIHVTCVWIYNQIIVGSYAYCNCRTKLWSSFDCISLQRNSLFFWLSDRQDAGRRSCLCEPNCFLEGLCQLEGVRSVSCETRSRVSRELTCRCFVSGFNGYFLDVNYILSFMSDIKWKPTEEKKWKLYNFATAAVHKVGFADWTTHWICNLLI